MIEVDNLSKKYGEFLAVDHIGFKVSKGSILGFLGPNGAGKTTTMRIITGYLPADEGRVKVAGFDVWEDPIRAKHAIGYLPENTPLYTHMRVAEYLSFMAELRRVPAGEIKRKVTTVVEKCWLGEVRDRIICTLSKGYRQRVGIAQALVHNPPVLVLDEPTIGLDPKQIIQVRRMIKELKDEHTVILSTHILPEVSAVCDRVVILDKGRVVAEDTPENLARLTHHGAARLMVRVQGPPAEVTAALEKMAGVLKVSVEEDLYHLETEAGRDVRSEAARTVVRNGWGLLELRAFDVSLEDVFLHLTTKEEEVALS